jgi:hypothetical protein
MQCNAEIGAGLDQLAVPGTDRRRSGLRPFCEPNFNGNSEALTSLVESLIDAGAAAVNDDDVMAVARDQVLQNDHRQLVACPRSLARYYDTHVQIAATERKHHKTLEPPFADRQMLAAE